MILLALDPGLNRSGVALFNEGRLVDVATASGPGSGDLAYRCACMAEKIWKRFKTVVVDEIVAEWPQVYDARDSSKSKPGSGNAVLPLAGVVVGVCVSFPGAVIRSVKPKEWKGTIPKPKKGQKYIVEVRARQRLDTDEHAVIPKRLAHDGWDAIGLGLYHLDRFGGRVFPGAT